MHLKNLLVFDGASPSGEYEYIRTTEEFAALARSPGAKPVVFSESLLALDETQWKRFMDTYIHLRAAAGWRGLPQMDFVDRERLGDYSYDSATFESSVNRRPQAPRFSFVIPFRDRDHTLPTVLAHLARLQAGGSCEIILVNDGSAKPLSGEVRQGLMATGADWTVVNLPPSKYFRAGFARNAGARRATGEFLVFIDSDILIPADFLAELESKFKSGDVIQAKRWQIWIDEQTGDLPRKLEEPNRFWSEFHQSTEPWMQRSQPWRYVSTYCLALRRAAFQELGGFRLWYSRYGFEDTDLGVRAFKHGLRLRRSDSDVFHLSPHTRQAAFNLPARRRREGAMRESARKYFILNDAVDSLDWLTHMMI